MNTNDQTEKPSGQMGCSSRMVRDTSVGLDMTDNWWIYMIVILLVMWAIDGFTTVGSEMFHTLFKSTIVMCGACGRITKWKHIQSSNVERGNGASR